MGSAMGSTAVALAVAVHFSASSAQCKRHEACSGGLENPFATGKCRWLVARLREIEPLMGLLLPRSADGRSQKDA